MNNPSKSQPRKRFVRTDQLDTARKAAARFGIADLGECAAVPGGGVYLDVHDDDWTLIKTEIRAVGTQ